MMISVYDDTGFFVASYDVEDDDAPDLPFGGGYVEGEFDPDLYYADAGVASERPSLVDDGEFDIVADGEDDVTIALPDGTVVTDVGTGDVFTSSGTEDLIVTAIITGDFDFVIEPPFPNKELTITVHAYADN